MVAGVTLAVLDQTGLRTWLQTATALVERHRGELDALNVFPVSDHDTGANVVATLRGALSGPDPATGALRSARGNSGLIIAELLRGILHTDQLTGPALSEGLRVGTARAYKAVAAPVEGTALSVAAAAADGDSGDLAEVALGAAARANRALIATREQLPQLTRAGVVDAGGRAVCLLLDALVEVVTGEPARPVELAYKGCGRASVNQRYEVQYEIATGSISELRSALGGLGDSLVTAELGEGAWTVHVHVADAGAAIEAGLAVGGLSAIRIEALPAESTGRGLVGYRLDILAGLLDSGLPADGPAIVLALGEPAVHRDGIAVIPVRSPVQAVAALAVHDPAAGFDDAVATMTDAAAATRCGEVRIGAETHGLIDEEVVVVGPDPGEVCAAVLDKMLAGTGELVTVLGDELLDIARRHLAAKHPAVEVQAYRVPTSGLLIGVE
jgi:hypothetical protein